MLMIFAAAAMLMSDADAAFRHDEMLIFRH